VTPNSQSGFTLAEALVSLFVFALIAGGAVTMLAQSLNSQQRVGEAQESLRTLQSARALLASDIAQIAPRASRNDQAPPVVFLATGGAEPRMSFVRSAGELGAEDQLSTSLVAVEYLLDSEGRLVRRTRTAIDPGPAAETRERALMEGATDVRFEFNDGGVWRSDWPASATGVPRAVAILANLPRYGAVRLQALTGL
jgi:general secretion pathway protein J